MREPRNPFLLRTSQHIESEANFLRLFGPDVLELLPKDGLWDRVQIFRSAPGGGKTSLFRVFTPEVLIALHELRTNEDYKDLYKQLKHLGVISDQGPTLLALLLPCTKNYATLEDLDIDSGRKERLFFALLNARVVLSLLRGALALRRLSYPSDLDRLRLIVDGDPPMQLPIPGSGKNLYDWACLVEKSICETLDSFGPESSQVLEGHDTLHSLSVIRPEWITCDGSPIANRVIVMFDDVNKLTRKQRRKLFETLFDVRFPVGTWLAERLEALTPDTLLGHGVTSGREYGEPVNLEDYWRSAKHSRRFEKVLTNIADRRAKSTRDIEAGPFAGYLKHSLDGMEWVEDFKQAIQTISNRIQARTKNTDRYTAWLRSLENPTETVREQATAYRSLEIKIERDIRKAQRSFEFESLPAPSEDHKEVSSIRSAAEFFISHEFGIPYYFGMSRLAVLSSSNIEQFLGFSAELFEEVISATLIGSQAALDPARQQLILKRVARNRWKEIPRRIPNGRDVQKLLDAIQQLAKRETTRPNAPYAPGVTGIGLTMANRDQLVDPDFRRKHPEYNRLLLALSACLSHNLLEVSLDRIQGQKGKTWMILYLNRWLCLHFDLPLGYGGWRPQTPADLCKCLLDSPHIPVRNEPMLKEIRL